MAVSIMAVNPALKDAYTQLKTRMDKAVGDFRNSLLSTRTGRASVHMVDTIRVPYYGSEMPLNQIAQVHAPEAQLITVQPFDPSSLPEIEKALRTSDMGFNPQNDGKLIRVPIPPLTEERRKELVKHLHKMLEDHRTAVRNIRRDIKEAIDKLEKDKKISQDEQKRSLDELEKLSHAETKKIEELSATKEHEVMELK